MNNEFLKMQKLAGLITEGRYKARLNEIEINKEELMPKFEEIWKDKTLDYSSLIGTDPIYKGLDGVLNNPKIKQNAFDWAYELTIEDEEEDSSMFKAYTSDGIDYEIMQAFAPQLAKNLIKAGFKYDKDESYWTIPSVYLNRLDKSRQNPYKNGATSYGIIWDFWGVDYDTSPRETISDYLEDAIESM